MTEQNASGLTPRQQRILNENPNLEITMETNADDADRKSDVRLSEQIPLNLKGVGGWLLLLIILLVLGVLLSLGRNFTDIESAEATNLQLAGTAAWETYKSQVWLLSGVGSSVAILAAGLLIFVHRPGSVRFAILALWLNGPIAAAIGMRLAEVPGDYSGLMFAASVQPVIWTAYLLRSRRVAITFGAG